MRDALIAAVYLAFGILVAVDVDRRDLDVNADRDAVAIFAVVFWPLFAAVAVIALSVRVILAPIRWVRGMRR